MTHVQWIAGVAAVVLTAGAYACTSTCWTGRGIAKPPRIQAPARLRAGAAREDITPPPGLALFGHGPEGRVSAGFRTRLYARAFVFEQSADAVALVTCDLGAISLELQRAVAEKLLTRDLPIGPQRLLLMATHTHAGPAHYFGSRMYSSAFASRAPGFDPRVLEFLAERIASAVARAWSTRVEAAIGWQTREVWDLTRNRSYAAFSANIGAEEPLTTDLDRQLRDAELRDKYSPARLAVDPTLSVLRIDRASDGHPLGVFAVFGMHQTAISNSNDLYHADAFGYAALSMETRINEEEGLIIDGGCHQRGMDTQVECPVIVGIANGIEGDVSPTYDLQAPREAKRLGGRLANEIERLWKTRGPLAASAGPVRFARYYRELRFPNGRVPASIYERFRCKKPAAPNSICISETLCASPQLGAASGGGAEDGTTLLRVLPVFQEGARRAVADGCHRRKRPLVPPSGLASSDGLDFPAVGPIELVELGDGAIAAAPAELTTWVGSKIREEIRAQLHDANAKIAVVGLTNAYFQYVTSPYEYEMQHYEGASTLYGPSTAAFLIGHFGCLAAVSKGEADPCEIDEQPAIDKVAPVAYQPNNGVARLPEQPDGLPETVTLTDVDVRDEPEDGVPGWRIEWTGIRPSDLLVGENMRVEIEVLASAINSPDNRTDTDGTRSAPGDVVADSDRGANITVRYLGDSRWSAHWVPGYRSCKPRCSQLFRFVVRGAVRVQSKPFCITCAGMEPAVKAEAE